MNNPAFELVRQHKQVTEETETLVLKKIGNKVSQSELLSIFEDGISGKYGKVYSLDPQTLLSWVYQYLNSKSAPKNYLDSPLISISEKGDFDWDKEANKCFNAFLRGVSEENFNAGVYNRMMIDGKIGVNEYTRYYKIPASSDPDNKLQWPQVMREVEAAQRKVLRDKFNEYKSKGYTSVYYVN